MSHCFGDRPSVLYKDRYCDQNEFDIIINHEDLESVYKRSANNIT